jgi:hypothetical protein
MRTDIRLNGSDLTMAPAKAAYWEKRAVTTHRLVVNGLRYMNRELEDARGVRVFGADRDSLNEIIVSNGNLIYHSLFRFQQRKPDLFAEETEAEEVAEESEVEEVLPCSMCAISDHRRAYTELNGARVCYLCFLRAFYPRA